jgi:hypothetical protein
MMLLYNSSNEKSTDFLVKFIFDRHTKWQHNRGVVNTFGQEKTATSGQVKPHFLGEIK